MMAIRIKLTTVCLFLMCCFIHTNAQKSLYSEIYKAVDQDTKVKGYPYIIELLKKHNAVGPRDFRISYASEKLKSIPAVKVEINTVDITDKLEKLSISDEIPSVEYFYNSEELSPSRDFTYVRISKYFDAKLNVKENVLKGFAEMYRTINSKNYRNVILLDDFGLSEPTKVALARVFADMDRNVMLVAYDDYKEIFPERSYYFTEIYSTESTSMTAGKYFYKATLNPKSAMRLNIVAFAPDFMNEGGKNYFSSAIYLMTNVAKQMPGVRVNLYMVDENDMTRIKPVLMKDMQDENATLGNVVIRGLNDLYRKDRLIVEGQNVDEPRKVSSSTKTTFRLEYIENNKSREALAFTMHDKVLVLGEPNSKPIWNEPNQEYLDEMVRFLSNYAQIQITSTAQPQIDRRSQTSGY